MAAQLNIWGHPRYPASSTIMRSNPRSPDQPTDEEDAAINASIASDPDTFEASSEQFRTTKRGRGIQKEATKIPVSIRLDQDIV